MPGQYRCSQFLKNFMENVPSGFDPRIKDAGFKTVRHKSVFL